MRRKLVAALLLGSIMMAMSVKADEAELLARIEALEARVSALEAKAGIAPEGTAATQEQETVQQEDVETGMVVNNCSLAFKRAELGKTYDNKDAVILYFDFTNGSGETTSAGYEFFVKVYQNNREQETATIMDNQAFNDRFVEFRSGADTVEVAFASLISDKSDIIVNISSMSDWDMEDVEFSVSLE